MKRQFYEKWQGGHILMFLPHFIFDQDQKYIKKHIEGKLSPSNLSDGIISCVIKIKKGYN